jgi:sterol desaturase/sphingolipid hydroxylase (fatty acid hydroxylase superfamily)
MEQYVSILGSTALLMLAFFLLERFVPGEDQPAAGRVFNYLYFPVVLAWVLVLQVLVGPLYVRGLALAGGGLLPRVVGPVSGPIGTLMFSLAFAFIWDVWQYWVHRWQHASATLWETHKLHHADTAVNSSSQSRHHLLNYALFTVVYVPMVMFFGSLAPHVIATFVLFRIWGFVNHMNAHIELGALTPVVAGPQFHRIHHSRLPQHFNRNFATFFPVIDTMFGTYYRPLPGEFPPTGLAVGELEPLAMAVTVAPVVAWYQVARASLTMRTPVVGDKVVHVALSARTLKDATGSVTLIAQADGSTHRAHA